MQDSSEFLCQYDGHDEDEILGFCLNQNCKQNLQFCLKCCWDKHADHQEDCKTFKQIQKVFASNKELEEQQKIELFDKIKQIQKLCEQITKNKYCYSERLKILEKDLKDNEYKKCLDNITFFKQYSQYLQTNQQKMILEQLDIGLSTLKLFTLGFTKIQEQMKLLGNSITSAQSEKKNTNQIQKETQTIQDKEAFIKAQKKDEEIYVNKEVQQQKYEQKKMQMMKQRQQKRKKYLFQQGKQSIEGQEQVQDKDIHKYINHLIQYLQYHKFQKHRIYHQVHKYLRVQYHYSIFLKVHLHKWSIPPFGKSGSSQIPNLPPNLQNLMSQVSRNQPRLIGQIPQGLPHQLQQQLRPQGSQVVDLQQLLNQINNGQLSSMKQILEFFIQQEAQNDPQYKNQPPFKIDLDPEQVKYYENEILPVYVIKQSQKLKEQGKYKEALDICNNAIEKYPYNSSLYFEKCKLLLALQKYQETLEICDLIIEADPEQTKILAIKGITLHLLNRYKEAIEFYDIAIELLPDDFAGHYYKGKTLFVMKQYEEALKRFERSLEIDSEHEEAYQFSGITLEKLEKYQQAIDNFNITFNINPKNQTALVLKAHCLNQLKNYQEAIETSDAAILLNPNSSDAHLNKGLGLLRMEAYKEAIECFEKVILIDDKQHQVYTLRGEALHNLHKYPEAVQSYDLAIKLLPDQEYIQKKAASLKAMEQNDEADVIINLAKQKQSNQQNLTSVQNKQFQTQ